MVIRLLFFTSIFFLSFNAHSQSKISEKDSLEIMSVMTYQENAWNKADVNTFMMGYHNSDELVFSGKNGPTYGWNNIKQRYLNSYPNAEIMGKLSFDVKKIRLVSENSAYLIGEYYLKRNTSDSYGHFTLLWKKINNKWFIISDHTSASY